MIYDIWQSLSPDGNVRVKVLSQVIEGDTFNRTLRCIDALEKAKQELIFQVASDAPDRQQIVSAKLGEVEDRFKSNHENLRYKKGNPPHPKITERGGNSKDTCFNCGNLGHRYRDSTCPAKEKQCPIYCRKGHFQEQCRSKKDKKSRRGEGSGDEKRSL